MIKHIELVNEWGKTLRGYLDMPENFNGELIVMFHGFTGNKSEHAYHFRNISRIMSKEGFASMRLDFSGNGESDGEFKDFTFDTLYSEAKQMIDFALNYQGVKKVSLLGFSMGGGVSTLMAQEYGNKISKLILWSPAGNITTLIKNRFENGVELENGNKLTAGYFELSKEMYESVISGKYNPMDNLDKFTNPVLLVHGRNDQAVSYLISMRYALKFYNSLVHIVDGSGHGYDKISEREELYGKTMQFLKYYENKQ